MAGSSSLAAGYAASGQGFTLVVPNETRRERTMDQDAVVPSGIKDWDETFAKQPDAWFFGREPSDLARQAYNYWKEIHGDRIPRVLDLGCGEGRDSVYLAGKGFEVTAVDAAASAIAKTERLARESGVELGGLVQSDIHSFPLESPFSGGSAPFDLILANNSLQFLGDDCILWLHGIQTATPSGGMNAISAFTRESESLAGRDDLYRFDRNELKFHYIQAGWRLLHYREEILWREPSKAYLSFAAVIAVKP